MVDDEPVRAQLQRALTAAMKQRDSTAVTALRSALSAIDNVHAVARPEPSTRSSSGPIAGARSGLGRTEAVRRDVPESEIVDVVRREVAEREQQADDYERRDRPDRARALRDEAAVLRSFLPG